MTQEEQRDVIAIAQTVLSHYIINKPILAREDGDQAPDITESALREMAVEMQRKWPTPLTNDRL